MCSIATVGNNSQTKFWLASTPEMSITVLHSYQIMKLTNFFTIPFDEIAGAGKGWGDRKFIC